ncbi:phospholipase A-2-activating protein [Microdochium trichocladiopsis]|uniref:Phospholipase A-2-activating protein n=1 Tax=Microdochium trichocladiopsis TaxID=1682393 RepID=A0A9P8Y4S5_9PEZI|nr:phospholipase A-2-activating protein [Microdochium trichocladiopsis]KAH7029567.1 phospholipase A-2-activating protein [Microdochium trichocladiopsis]
MARPSDFKLSAQLLAHEADVRDVSFPSADLLLSASRDHTVRAWRRSQGSPPTFEPSVTNKGTEFVNSLAYLPASSDYPDGLVVSAGTDTIIDIRSPAAGPSDNAERLLIGHSRNICSLAVVPGANKLVSGSWDNSARIWSISKWEVEAILTEHEGAVWDVLPIDDRTIVTGCADKSIRIFDPSRAVAGEVTPKSTISTPDIVRAICKVPAGHPTGADIASGHNDGVIRLYKLSGQQVGELHGHESFIYALTTLPTGEIVSSGEDRTVRIWSGTECVQTITHPAISVWTVAACPENGDIATGASDGVVRVFSRSPERAADAETLSQFDEAVKSSSIPQQQVGGINKEKLPGPEFLTSKSGTKEGQVQMIREENGNVTAHQWSMGQQQWINVGTVVDAVGSSGKKTEYQGKMYDYVFDVAIEEGQPSLKLPYNLSENPYERATKFINDNELSLNFLDQVAQFIVQNTQGATIGQSADTGADQHTASTNTQQPASSRTKVIPQREYLDITAAKYEPIFKKIASINAGLVASGRKDHSLNPDAQNVLTQLKQSLEAGKPAVTEEAAKLVFMMCTQWDYADRLAPMDLLRCIAVHPTIAKYRTANDSDVVTIATAAPFEGVPAGTDPNENCCMMAARTIANLFKTQAGRETISQPAAAKAIDAFISRVLGFGGQQAVGAFNRNLFIALTTVLINLSVLASWRVGSISNAVQVHSLTLLSHILQKQTDSEVVYRALIASGTLVTSVGTAAPDAKSMAFPVRTAKDKASEDRVKEVADELLSLLSK